MSNNRRNFIKTGMAAGMGLGITSCTSSTDVKEEKGSALSKNYNLVDEAFARPILRKELFPEPIIIESVDLFRKDNSFICKVKAKNGAEGICVSNNYQMIYLHPIQLLRVNPFFIGKDARDLETILDELYVFKSNYKLQSLALWVPVATVEFAILDMLGKIANVPMGALIGNVEHPDIGVYQANNYRGKTAEESIEGIKETVEKTGAKALKFKIGGRMSNDKDYPPHRSENLIPLIRKAFGDNMVVYADSNGSYTAEEAIRIGKMLEAENFDFYEEPVPFDWYQETKEVADALKIPIAGGEQEPSMRSFRWLIANDALDIVQPDIFYFGGMIRSMKVARMAQALGKECIPHISGSGLGFLYMMHFVSAVPNAGPFHEFKGFNDELPMTCPTSDLIVEDGKIQVPTGPGLGVDIDPDYVAKHKILK